MPPRFPLLRVTSLVIRIFAWVVLVFCEVFGVIALVTGGATAIPTAPGQPPLPGWAAGLVLILLGPVYFSMIYAIGGVIPVLIEIADNTKKS